MAKAKKVEALVKIGLPLNDARICVDLYAPSAEKKARFTFGVELECSVPYNQICSENANMFKYAGYTHQNERKMFKFVTDTSVNAGDDNIECVSPVLGGNKTGYATLRKACKILSDKNAKVNSSCGYHVHIGAANLTEEQYVNVFINYQKCEKVIDTFMQKDRRASNAYYCRSLKGLDFSHCRTREDVQMVFGHGTINSWRGSARYYKVNAMAYVGHKTIEFRHHGGTTNAEKVENWVKFCMALVEWSMKHRMTEEARSIEDLAFLSEDLKTYCKARKAHFDAKYHLA